MKLITIISLLSLTLAFHVPEFSNEDYSVYMEAHADDCGICTIDLVYQDVTVLPQDDPLFFDNDWVGVRCDALNWTVAPDRIWLPETVKVRPGLKGYMAYTRVVSPNGFVTSDSDIDRSEEDIRFMGMYMNQPGPDYKNDPNSEFEPNWNVIISPFDDKPEVAFEHNKVTFSNVAVVGIEDDLSTNGMRAFECSFYHDQREIMPENFHGFSVSKQIVPVDLSNCLPRSMVIQNDFNKVDHVIWNMKDGKLATQPPPSE